MKVSALHCLFALAGMAAISLMQAQAPATPAYDKDGGLLFPEKYREWIYLGSGLDMNYNPKSAGADTSPHSTFENVFVNPEAYAKFVDTGTWPDKTVLVLELREAQNKGSINQSGHYQGAKVKAMEVHVKDESRFSGKWAFFGFGNGTSGKLFPSSASCYSCHAEHAAVDTTFVQFYPTLVGIAEKKGTFSPAYTKETGTATATK